MYGESFATERFSEVAGGGVIHSLISTTAASDIHLLKICGDFGDRLHTTPSDND